MANGFFSSHKPDAVLRRQILELLSHLKLLGLLTKKTSNKEHLLLLNKGLHFQKKKGTRRMALRCLARVLVLKVTFPTGDRGSDMVCAMEIN